VRRLSTLLPRRILFPGSLIYGLLLVTLHEYGMSRRTIAVQLLCVAAALFWVMTRRAGDRRQIQRRWSSVALVLAFCALALGLRVYLLTFLPPSNQTGFEEMETGGLSYRILRTGMLPLEFRYTNCLGAIGFLFGGETLWALRAPFKLASCVALLLLMLCLRDLKVGWLPTGLIVVMAASLRWLVIGNVADELFAGLPLTAAVIVCVVRSEQSADRAPFWASLAGLFSGVLMYEYSSFRVMIVFAGGWYLWRTFTSLREERNVPRIRLLSSFSVPLLLVSLPLLVDVFLNPGKDPLFEAFRRHGGERSTPLAGQSLDYMKQYTLALAGRVVPTSLWLTRESDPIVPPVIGGLFGCAFLLGLVRPRQAIERGFALATVILIVTASVTANDLKVGRLLPAVLVLCVLSGLLLERLAQWLRALPGHTGSALELSLFVAGAFTVVAINSQGVRAMAVDPMSLQEYANDDYATAFHAAHVAAADQALLIWKPDTHGKPWELRGMQWLFAPKRLTVRVTGRLPAWQQIAAGTLVVVGVRNHDVPPSALEELRAVAKNTGSLSSFRQYRNAAGDRSVASICVQCGPSRPTGDQ